MHVKFYMQLGKFACIFSCNFACIFSHVFFLWNLRAILLISTHETRLQCCNAHGLCCMHSFVFTKLNCSESLAYWFCENKLMRICRTSTLSMKKSIFLSHEVWAHSPVGILRACESVICGWGRPLVNSLKCGKVNIKVLYMIQAWSYNVHTIMWLK